jgi:hypothetical protein
MVLCNTRVPVVGKDGKPLMPTKTSRARRWIKEGKALPKWSKLGIFYVQLTVDSGTNTQDIGLGLDPGSKFDGIAVVSRKEVLQTGMTELPQGICKKMEQRKNQRRNRRYRKCRRRKKRFDNRTRPEDWLAPSQKAKVDFKLTIIGELRHLYPISICVVEDVCFDHYTKRWGKYFSTVEIGKTLLYDTLQEWCGQLTLVSGVATALLREKYKVAKCPDKRKRGVASHAIDALVIIAEELGLGTLEIPSFYVWKRYQYPRRQLHKFQYEKGGTRRREGGSSSLNGFKKGGIVVYRERLARVGGYMEGKMSLHTCNVNNKRFTQRAAPEECRKLFTQRIMYEAASPLPAQAGSLLAAGRSEYTNA